jgi:hypothetical protein
MTRDQSLSCLFGFGFGAALIYLLDPDAGGRRRALVRNKAVWAARKTADRSAALARDLRNRTAGIAAEFRNRRNQDIPEDAVLEARVRTALGRASTHAGAIGVSAIDGLVLLVGPVLESDYDRVYRTVCNVPGVVDVDDQLTVHQSAESVPGLQGEGSSITESSLSGWAPAALAGGVTAAAVVGLMLAQRR